MLEGLEVTLVGMFAVFSFLFILVCTILLVSKLICLTDKICPMVKETQTRPVNNISEEIAVAISAIKARF